MDENSADLDGVLVDVPIMVAKEKKRKRNSSIKIWL
jgi:hypothetical protein